MAATGGTVGMTLAQIKTGQLKATLPGVRQMQLQQIPIAQQQQRKNATAATSRFVVNQLEFIFKWFKEKITIFILSQLQRNQIIRWYKWNNGRCKCDRCGKDHISWWYTINCTKSKEFTTINGYCSTNYETTAKSNCFG